MMMMKMMMMMITICIGIVLDFPWDIFMSQGKLQTQGNWGTQVYYGVCASRELHLGCVSITFVRLKKQIKRTISHTEEIIS